MPEAPGPRKDGQLMGAARSTAGDGAGLAPLPADGAVTVGAAGTGMEAAACARPKWLAAPPRCTRTYSIVPPRPPDSTPASLPFGPRDRVSPIGTSTSRACP